MNYICFIHIDENSIKNFIGEIFSNTVPRVGEFIQVQNASKMYEVIKIWHLTSLYNLGNMDNSTFDHFRNLANTQDSRIHIYVKEIEGE